MQSEVKISAASSTTNLVLEKMPVIYGIRYHALDGTQVDGHTHEFTVFIEHANEDLSQYVDYVQFSLPLDTTWLPTVENPPYEATGTGQGEFMASIKICFRWGLEPFRSFVLYYAVNFSNGCGEILPGAESIKSNYEEIYFCVLREKPKMDNFVPDHTETAGDNSPDSTTE